MKTTTKSYRKQLLLLLITSISFVSSSQIVEDFETASAWPWAPWVQQAAGGVKVATPVHTGSYSLENPDWHYRTDVSYGNAGDDISMWVYFTAAGRTYWGFGADAAGCYSVVVAPNTSEFIIQDNSGYGYIDLAAVPYTYQLNRWYRAELVWNSNTNITANLYDSNGTTLLTSVTTTIAGLTPGGFALRGFGGAYMDDLGRNCATSGTAPVITANGSTNLCPGDQVQLESDITNNISWNTGATTPTINVSTGGSYFVSTLDNCAISAGLVSNTINVTLNPNPTVTANVNPGTTVCPNESITLFGSGTATSYTWNNGVTDGSAFNIASTTTYEVTGTDGNGCSSTDQITITAVDNTAPVPNTALSDITQECEVVSLSAPSATDNCDGTLNGTHNAVLPISSNTTITWTYTDASGNSSTQTQNVIINDNTAPVADVANLPNITEECEVVSLSAPSATDNCDGLVLGTHNATFPITTSSTVTWTYADMDGNTSTQNQQIIINDVTAPIADLANLPNIQEECEVISLTAPTATDNCDGTITGTHNASLPITTNTTITWSYSDVAGNITTQTQNVVINDVTAPTEDLASLPSIQEDCEVVSLTPPTATDNCDGTVTGTHNITLPITSSTTVTWTYTDAAGNVSTQNQQIIIDDVTNPVADLATLANIEEECQVVSLTAPTATDNCDGSISATHNQTLPITSNTTITWTYVDAAGNASTQTQDVVIDDITAPVADETTLQEIVETCEVTNLNPPTATDNCDGTLTGTHNAVLPITTNTTITWTYMDAAGNTSTQTQDVVLTGVDATTSVSEITISANNINAGASYQWINCDENNIAINGETNVSFTPESNGNYAVVVSENNCSDTSDCVAITTVSLSNNDLNSSIHIYPNPSNGKFTVESELINQSFVILDAQGREVLNGRLDSKKSEVDLSSFETGIYYLNIDDHVIKLIKN